MAKNKWVLQAVIFSALRRMFRRSPMYNDCLKNAKRDVYIKGKTKDKIRRVKYVCCGCGYLFDKKQVEVDHCVPVIPLAGLPKVDDLPDFNVYIARLFCSVENLQVVCKPCHKTKSKLENAERKRLRDEQSGKPTKQIPNDGRRKPKSTPRSPGKGVRKPRK
jgi:5-methylcytosine-specific restriction endonuclease McrA